MSTSTTRTQVEIPATDTLVDVPKRAFAFLNAIGTQPAIREVLFVNGYTEADHAEGWDLLHKAAGAAFSVVHVDAGPAQDAVRALDAADEVLFHRAHAALVRSFTPQVEFLFNDLVPTAGPAAVLGVMKFLDRIDALEKGRAGAEADDQKAVGELTARGIDAAERARLRKLVTVAENAGPVPPPDPKALQSDEEHAKALAALYGWYAAWTELAHAVISRRNDRILLGIAKRRKKEAPAAAAVNGSTGKAPSGTPKVTESAA